MGHSGITNASSGTASFRLRTLGGVFIESADGPLTGAVSQRRRLALLSLLAASPSGISRDRLVALLWPESDDERARHALAQLLYALRRDLGGEAVTGSATAIRLDPAIVSSDVNDFARAISSGDLERAAELHAGPFLDGFHLGGCPEFERWVDEERARLLFAVRKAIETLAGRSANAGDFAGAVRWWQRLAALDPFDARVALALMRALAAAGERGAALRHARAYDVLVRDELGTSPDAAIVEFAESLARAASSPPSAGEPAQRAAAIAGHADMQAGAGVASVEGPPAAASPAEQGASDAIPLPVPRRRRFARAATVVVAIAAAAVLVVLASRSGGRDATGPDRIVLGDVENTTGDPIFDRTIPLALSAGIGQSEALRVLSPQRISETLVRMRRTDPDAVLDESTAREIAVREDARFVIVPAVGRSEPGYELSARLLDPATAGVLAFVAEPAASQADVIDALDRLSKRLRRGAGESARSIETRSTPLPRLTTHSLAALEKYANGARAFNTGQWPAAAALWREAVNLDDSFATAHASLGMHAYFTNRATDGEAWFARALASIEGLPPREQTLIRANIETWRGNRDSAVVLLRTHLSENPGDIAALGRLGYNYLRMGRSREGVEVFRRLVQLDSLDVFVLINLATVEKGVGDLDSAIIHYRRAFAVDPAGETADDNINHEYGSTWVLAGQLDSATAVFSKMLTKGRIQRARGLRSLAFLAMYRGHYAEAARGLTDAIRLARLAQANTTELRNRLLLATSLARRGLAREATEQLDSAYVLAHRFDVDPILMFWLGKTLARSGDLNRAERVLERLDANRNAANASAAASSAALRGEILVARGTPASAFVHLETAMSADSNSHTLESLAHAVAQASQLERARLLYQELSRGRVFGSEGQELVRQAPHQLGRIAEQAGDVNLAIREYERFLEAWQDAEPMLPILIEVRDRINALRADRR